MLILPSTLYDGEFSPPSYGMSQTNQTGGAMRRIASLGKSFISPNDHVLSPRSIVA